MTQFQRQVASVLLGLAMGFNVNSASARVTYLEFSSAPNTVGQGLVNYRITPGNGWQFNSYGNIRNGVSFQVVKGQYEEFWFLDLTAAFIAPIVPGIYLDAQRYHIGDYDKPGLTLSGNGWGVNSAAGHFEVYEARLGPGNVMDQFSVDFTQYDEGDPERWVKGKLRFNAHEVPEPSGLAVCGVGITALIWLSSRRLRCPQG